MAETPMDDDDTATARLIERQERLGAERLGGGAKNYGPPPLNRTVSSYLGRGGGDSRRPSSRRGGRAGGGGGRDRLDPYDLDDTGVVGSVSIPLKLSVGGDEERDDGDGGGGGTAEIAEAGRAVASFDFAVPPPHGSRWNARFGGSSGTRDKCGYASGRASAGYRVTDGARVECATETGDGAKVSLATVLRARGNEWPAFRADVSTVPRSDTFALTLSADGKIWSGALKGSASIQVLSNRRFCFARAGLEAISNNNLPILTLGLNMGIDDRPIKVSSEKHMSDKSSGRFALEVGRRSFLFEGMIKRSLSEFASFSTGLRHTTAMGLAWLFQLERGGVSFDVPILISGVASEKYLSLSFIGKTAYLAFLSGIIDGAICDLVGNEQVRTRISSSSNGMQGNPSMEQTISLLNLEKARREAEQQTRLMARQAATKTKVEEGKNGLVIVRAMYGVDIERGNTLESQEGKCEANNMSNWLDVTTQLQFWVTESTLRLPASSKRHMLGFFDISQYLVSEKMSNQREAEINTYQKGTITYWISRWWRLWMSSIHSTQTAKIPMLVVQYKFEGNLYEMSIQDGDALSLPDPRAQLIGSK